MTTVCVLFGGASSEHEVSLRSAASVLRNINKSRYDIITIGITKSGRWLRYLGVADDIESGAWEAGDVRPAIISPDRGHKGIIELTASGAKTIPVDVIFPVLHGKNGEDGTIQGLAATAGIPCVGCGVLASAVCMDKAVSHVLLVAAGVPKTTLVALTCPETLDFEVLEKRLANELGYPMFVKPANAGSSVGVSKAKDAVQLRDAFSLAFNHDRKIVIEQCLYGREIECAVMGNENPVASDVIGEVAPENEFYDYSGKYLDGSTQLYIPARITDADVVQKVRELSIKAYKALGCAGLSRIDFFVSDSGEITLNEVNTLPVFTSISMYSKLFVESGVAYSELIDRLIAYALDAV